MPLGSSHDFGRQTRDILTLALGCFSHSVQKTSLFVEIQYIYIILIAFIIHFIDLIYIQLDYKIPILHSLPIIVSVRPYRRSSRQMCQHHNPSLSTYGNWNNKQPGFLIMKACIALHPAVMTGRSSQTTIQMGNGLELWLNASRILLCWATAGHPGEKDSFSSLSVSSFR